MNKMDIAIMHVEACKNISEAWEKIDNPLKGFGFKITRNEQTLLKYYAKLYFSEKTDTE